jgi:histidinol-phosphatase (PHP family)
MKGFKNSMKVDFHFHLEEGPYSLDWMKRTTQALIETSKSPIETLKNTLQWMEQMSAALNRRMEQGCFTEEWILRFLDKGRAQGIERFGLVDHLYRFTEFKAYYEKYMLVDDSLLGQMQREWLDKVCTYSIQDFLAGARSLANEREDLSIGVEADYFPGADEELQQLLAPYELDYVIGAVHFNEGWGFDNPAAQYKFEQLDLLELYKNHFHVVKQAIASRLFEFIAHLDNMKVFGYRPDENLLLPYYIEVAAALKEANLATEINTGLAYRYPVKEMCPSPTFLQILFEHQIPITLSSDAHFPDDIGTLLNEAMELAKQTGYEEIVYFKNRKKYIVPIV